MIPLKNIAIIIFFAGTVFAQNNPPEQKAPLALPSILHITSEPNGAKVYVNTTFVGLTPFQEEIKPGKYMVNVKKDFYGEDSLEITLSPAKVISHAFTLQAKFGIIEIITAPESGADVFLNNSLVGFTPYTSQQLPKGEYSLKIKKRFFKDYEWKCNLGEGKTDRRTITLENNSGKLTVRSPFSKIVIDGKDVGNNDFTGRLDTGKHIISVDRSKQYIPIEQEIILAANDVRSLELEPQPRLGGVSVIVEPENAADAEVYVNDTLKGKAPIVFPMIIGTHNIRVKKINFKEEKEYFTILETENTTLKFRMITLEEDRQRTINKWNYSKWISAGVGILAIGTSIYFNGEASKSYSAYSSAQTNAEAMSFRNQTNRQTTYFSISAGFVVTATATAIYSWIKERSL